MVTASLAGLQATAQLQVLNPAGAPKVSVVQSGTQNTNFVVENGTQFNVDLRIDKGSDIWGWSMNINWNPDVLKLLNVTEGPYLKQVASNTLFFVAGINNTLGITQGGINDINLENYNAANGSGVLATLTFQAVGSGNSSIAINTETSALSGPSTPPDYQSTEFPFLTVNSAVSVLPPCPIDFCHTGTVNFQDIVYFVSAYIQYHQTGYLNPACDLNRDGTLDFNDIVLFVADYQAYAEAASE